MNFKNLLFTISITVLLLSSCSVTKTTARTIEANKSMVIIKPLLAVVEVDINKKITGKVTVKRRKVLLSEAKELAKADAILKSGADIIIDPVFRIVSSFNNLTVEVTGFFGKYTKIAPIEGKDLENLELYQEKKGYEKGGVTSRLVKLKNRK